MRSSAVLQSALAVGLAATPFVGVRAQSRPAAQTPVEQPAATGKAPAGSKVLELEDYARWNRITSPALSADGKWMTVTYSPNEGGQTILHVKSLDGGTDYTASVGEAAGGGGRAGGGRGGAGGGNAPSFSDDSKWAAYFVNPQTRGAAGRGGRGRGGAPTPSARGAADAEQPAAVAHLELLNLATGDKVEIPGAASRRFSSDSRWLAVKLNRAPGAAPVADAAPAGGRGGRGGGGAGAAGAPGALTSSSAT